ncbi:MAG: hypothetical protein E7541_04840 [Ruminococcaceae bacterium]|nr:hypothetical protein [Oscillospiraceae bacterium]
MDVIELPELSGSKADTLLVRTIASFVKKSVLSVAAGIGADSIAAAAAALHGAAHGRIRIELPLSPVGMEYTCRKKPAAMLEWITKAVTEATASCDDVEFCAVDATRAEGDFLQQAIEAAVNAGAKTVSVCDSTGEKMPDDFAAFAASLATAWSVPLMVRCDNKNGLAAAQAILAVRAGAAGVKTAVGGHTVPLESFATMIKNCGDSYGFTSHIRYTELHRIIRQIGWVTDNAKNDTTLKMTAEDAGVHLDAKDDKTAVVTAAAGLGYDLSDEDQTRVFEEFQRVAAKKNVGAKELDAIIASVALQVPATYKLDTYVINSGNVVAASAQLTLIRDEKPLPGIATGDGPIDAAFRTIEQITGRHFELDDFQIQAVTEGREAMGSALVKLRSGGKVYSGNGISTDIIGASIRAYLSAVNKIVYEEA